MTRSYKYVGPYDEVEVPALGTTVKQGETVVVDDKDVADGLDGQSSWEHIPDKQRSQAAKKAAETRASDDQEG